MNKNNLSNNLYLLRRKAGLSQEEFAEKLCVSRQAVSKWERGEAYPDTENLIVISEMFSVSIDELLKSDNICYTNSSTEEEADRDQSDEDGLHIKFGDAVKVALDGGICVNDKDGQVKVNIGKGGIVVNDEDGVEIKLGKCGIEINDDDHHRIVVNSGVNDDDHQSIVVNSGRERSFASVMHAVPYPMVVVIAFLALGIFFNVWYWAWTLFLTVPIYYPLISAIHRKRFTVFPYPVFITFIFCLFGMLFGIWHPLWVLYLTVPIYYQIASAIDKYIATKKRHR